MGECSAVRPIAAYMYRQTQRSSLQLGLRVGGHLVLTDFRADDPNRTLTYGWRRIDSIINIAVSISIILVLYQTSGKRMPLAYLIFDVMSSIRQRKLQMLGTNPSLSYCTSEPCHPLRLRSIRLTCLHCSHMRDVLFVKKT